MYGGADRLVIVADDLTGAADTVVSLTGAGAASLLLDHAGDWPATDLLAVDTDSRHAPADLAAARVADLAHRARALGADLYKKVDSTLRGNIAAELAAMVEALGVDGSPPLVVLAPAFPATGRTTVRGVVHVDGRPHGTRDGEADVVALLERGGLRTRLLPVTVPGSRRPRASTAKAAESLAVSFHRACADGVDAVVVDATTEEDLRHVAAAAALAEPPLLLAGSGGLARALAHALPAAPAPATRPPSPGRSGAPARPELVVIGSRAPQSQAQRRRLAEHGVRCVVLTEDQEAVAAQVRAALATGPVVLSPDPDEPVVPARAVEVARRLAQAAAASLDRAGTLVATGGETARAVLTAAGVDRLTVLGETAPGVVRSHVAPLGLDVVTKAGAFGDPDALLHCLTYHSHPSTRST